MFETNKIIIDFLLNNFILVSLLIFSIFKTVPPEWAGFWKFNNNHEEEGRAPRITAINFVLTGLFDSVIRAFFIPLIATFGLKDMVTLVILLVVIFDIFVRKEISGYAVTLVSVGIVTLYLDRLIQTGRNIKLFGILEWNKDIPIDMTNVKKKPAVK